MRFGGFVLFVYGFFINDDDDDCSSNNIIIIKQLRQFLY